MLARETTNRRAGPCTRYMFLASAVRLLFLTRTRSPSGGRSGTNDRGGGPRMHGRHRARRGSRHGLNFTCGRLEVLLFGRHLAVDLTDERGRAVHEFGGIMVVLVGDLAQ